MCCVGGHLVGTVNVRGFSRPWAGDPAVPLPLTLSKAVPSCPFLGCPEELKIEKIGIAPCSDELC